MIDTVNSINSLARVQSAWKHAPHELLSLWDMIAFSATRFWTSWEKLDYQLETARKWIATYESEPFAAGSHKNDLWQVLASLESECAALEMDKSLHRIKMFKKRAAAPADISARVVESELAAIKETIWSELGDRHFLFIPPQKSRHFDNSNLFGDEVELLASEDLVLEIRSAGTCLAMDLNTAAVFHLMRAAEMIMRSIARHLGIGAVKSKTIEQAGWDEIIRKIRAELQSRTEKYSKRKTKKRSDLDEIRRLEALADDLNVLKEIWRNNVMHTRDKYDAAEAMGVLSRVANFAKRAAEKIPLS